MCWEAERRHIISSMNNPSKRLGGGLVVSFVLVVVWHLETPETPGRSVVVVVVVAAVAGAAAGSGPCRR